MATLGAEFNEQEPAFLRQQLSRLASWIGSERSINSLERISVFALIGIAIATVLYLTREGAGADPLAPAAAATLLVANLLPATTLLVLFGRRLALRRARQVTVGSKQMLHVRLVAIFSLISAIPTLLLVIFASLLFQSGVQFWFSASAKDMLNNSAALAQGYTDEKIRDISDDSNAVATDLRFILGQVPADSSEFLNEYFKQILIRKFSESAIVTIGPSGTQQTSAVVSPDDKRNGQWIDDKEFSRLKAGENIVVTIRPDRINAVMVLFEKPRSYLYTSRTINVPSYKLGATAKSVLAGYETMESRSRNLQVQFNIALYLVSLLIIGITVWVALLVADRLVRPVTNLVQAAQKIADGDLSVRVPEDPERSDEVGFLSQSFNLMTDRLESQTSTLITANRQLDERRAFIEAVLESVSAGIISLDNDGNIRLANSTAEKLLVTNESTIVGHSLKSVSPKFAELIDIGQQQAVVQIGDDAEPLTVAVKISQREGGHVVTFEDISQQLADQRRAAWSDVARRIAHEIKNPLTPIQLAAERLQRRFGKQIVDGAPVFEQLTGTIVRQVGDLRNIVDEFSSFARMPKPVLRQESIIDIVGHAVFLHEVAHTDISFTFEHDTEIPPLVCDRRQLGQAITNILKNAVEAVEERKKNGTVPNDFRGIITAKIETLDDYLTLRISDNGTGLPKDRDRILEPYVTTRATGSGLGLAIVKKIIEEHFAEVSFSDAEGGGAMISIRFSPKTLAARAMASDTHFIQQTDIKDKDQS
jgi:two-component system, NtrC family, nitrogen regulation sensor histidine kinase NtrY